MSKGAKTWVRFAHADFLLPHLQGVPNRPAEHWIFSCLSWWLSEHCPADKALFPVSQLVNISSIRVCQFELIFYEATIKVYSGEPKCLITQISNRMSNKRSHSNKNVVNGTPKPLHIQYDPTELQ